MSLETQEVWDTEWDLVRLLRLAGLSDDPAKINNRMFRFNCHFDEERDCTKPLIGTIAAIQVIDRAVLHLLVDVKEFQGWRIASIEFFHNEWMMLIERDGYSNGVFAPAGERITTRRFLHGNLTLL
ncbi:MAG: hypothetical protein HY459_04755 [Parcubacteria group bacterium]|nr:hypothetical protein [Parcubacteria group bacterium]